MAKLPRIVNIGGLNIKSSKAGFSPKLETNLVVMTFMFVPQAERPGKKVNKGDRSSVSTSILKSIAKYIFILALPLLLVSCGDDAADSGSLRATAKMPRPRRPRLAKKAAAPKEAVKVRGRT